MLSSLARSIKIIKSYSTETRNLMRACIRLSITFKINVFGAQKSVFGALKRLMKKNLLPAVVVEYSRLPYCDNTSVIQHTRRGY